MLTDHAIYKNPRTKPALSALSLSLVLSLSACSSETGSTAAPTANNDADNTEIADIEVADTITVADAEPVAETTAPSASIENEAVAVDAASKKLAADAGAQLYDVQCKVCHDNGLLNAPKYGDKVAWASALAKNKQTLYSHSAQGFNKMPAQAINGVSEAQVKAAVDYMLAAVS